MPDILYMRGAGLSKPFLHANCLQYAGRPPLLTFFHYVLAVFLLLASNYNFCRPRTGGGGGGGVGKEKKAVGKNEKNLHFFFFSFVQIRYLFTPRFYIITQSGCNATLQQL